MTGKKRSLFCVDTEWKKGFIKFGELHEDTDYYPVFVESEPSQTHLKLRNISKHLGNAYVFRELTNLVGTTAIINIGNPIKLSILSHLE